MTELDFGNIYSSNGEIIQLRYAQKRAETGSTVLAMKNSRGAVLIVSKPRLSNLHVQESDHRIRKLAPNAYMSYTGLLTDGMLIYNLVKKAVRDYTANYGTEISAEYLKKIMFDYLYMFTAHMSLRIIGSTFLTITKDQGSYQVMLGEPSGKISRWKACATGIGQRRAFTELEKLKLEEMSIKDMVDQGIKILYKCYDPLNDPVFDVEVGYISDESNGEFVRVNREHLEEFMNKYKDLSIDDNE